MGSPCVDISYINDKVKSPESGGSLSDKDLVQGSELWIDGLICAFELVQGERKAMSQPHSKVPHNKVKDADSQKMQVRFYGMTDTSCPNIHDRVMESNLCGVSGRPQGNFSTSGKDCQYCGSRGSHDIFGFSHWRPIGWNRISELVEVIQPHFTWAIQQYPLVKDEDDLTVADLASPYWEQPGGPTWWCHVCADHTSVITWFSNAQWLHPAVSIALRDEGRLISERMKYLFYEVPVRVAGGLLFELLGQSVGDPYIDEDDLPVVLRSWQAQNFLITAQHVKGSASRINVLGVIEVQELLLGGGYNVPRSSHELIAQLASRLTRWDDRLFRKHIFGEADEIELKFMNRRNHEDMNLFTVILNQEIRRLSKQVIRVKWSLHAREEIVFELLQHLRGNAAKALLEAIRKSTREMIEEQEAVRGRLFTIQDVMQSTVRAWLQDKSLRVTHNLAVFGGCGLVLSIITGLFGINVDGIPGAGNTPFAFGLFTAVLFFVGVVLIVVGLLYLGLKKPLTGEQVEVRKLELQDLVKMFHHEAESHAQLRNSFSRNNLPPTAADLLPRDADYFLIA